LNTAGLRLGLGKAGRVHSIGVSMHTAGRMHTISLRMHTAGRMHSIGHGGLPHCHAYLLVFCKHFDTYN